MMPAVGAKAVIRAAAWFGLMLAIAIAASIAADRLAPQMVTSFDTRHNIDFRVGLQLPVRVVWGAHNGWPLVTVVWLMAIGIGVSGWQFARALGATGARGVGLVMATQAVLGAVLSFFPMTFSADPYAYIIWGRLFGNHGVNPYLIFARMNPGDDQVLARCLQFYGNPPPADDHGPLWTLLSGAIARLEAHASLWFQFWTYRAIGVAAAVLTTLGLKRLLGGAATPGLLAAFAFNPLVVYETGVGGHDDMLMVALAVWSFAIVERYALLAALLLGASVSIKFVSLLAAPFLLVRAAGGSVGRAVLAAVVLLAVPALTFQPFWQGLPTLFALVGHTGVIAMSPTWLLAHPFFAAGRAAGPALPWLPPLPLIGQPTWPRLIQLVLFAAFAVVLAVSVAQHVRRTRHDGLGEAPDSGPLWRSVTAFLWSSPVIHPWYLLWLAPVTGTASRWARFGWWFAALALVRYVLDATNNDSPFAAPNWTMAMLTLAMLGLPVLLGLGEWRHQRARTADRTA